MSSTSHRKRRRNTIACVALLLWSGVALAATIPGLPTAGDLRSHQQEAETAFAAGSYDKAVSIYRDTLASAGDKYAQYMVGWMHLHGLGVDADPVLAAAWFALAAERRDDAYVRVHDEVLGQLNASDTSASTAKAAQLIETYGDCALVKQALARRQAGEPDPQYRLSASGQPEAPRFGPSERRARGQLDPRESKRKLHDMQRYLARHCP